LTTIKHLASTGAGLCGRQWQFGGPACVPSFGEGDAIDNPNNRKERIYPHQGMTKTLPILTILHKGATEYS
jgi:hypothetical protein